MPRKLSEVDAEMIRRRRLAGENVTKLCLEYNVTPSTIYNIERGVTYRGGDGTTKKFVQTSQQEIAEKVASFEGKTLTDEEINALPIEERLAYARATLLGR